MGCGQYANQDAAGVVCRDENGAFLRVFEVVFEDITNPAMLEAYACREAFTLGVGLGLAKIDHLLAPNS